MELSNDDWPPGMDKKDAGGARYYKVLFLAIARNVRPEAELWCEAGTQ